MLETLFSLFLLLMPVTLQAQEHAEYVNAFGGVDSYQDSSKIAKTDAQDARNVLTDNGKLTKRPGSVALTTVVDGYPVYSLGEYISPANIRYLIAHASETVYATDLSASGFVAIATVTAGYPIDFTSAFGKVYFTNGIDTPFSWDGTTTVVISTIPKCVSVEFADERLYCSNAPNFKSTVYASRFGDATDWTIPVTYPLPADAPNSFTFNRQDGDQNTCFKVTPWGKFVGKRNSSYILKGYDNDHYYKQLVSPTVGCLDDRSMQMVDGKLVWLGQDSTVYSWDGATAPEPISRDIDSYVKSIRQAAAQQNNYNTSTLAEWRTGAVSTNSRTALDIETWPGSLRPSTWTHINTEGSHWNAGTLVDIDTVTADGSILLDYDSQIDNFSDFYTSFDGWTVTGTNLWSAYSATQGASYRKNAANYAFEETVTYKATSTANSSITQAGYLRASNALHLNWYTCSTTNNQKWESSIKYYFVADSTTPATLNGYAIGLDCETSQASCVSSLIKIDNGVETELDYSTTNVGAWNGFQSNAAISGSTITVSPTSITVYANNNSVTPLFEYTGVLNNTAGAYQVVKARFRKDYTNLICSSYGDINAVLFGKIAKTGGYGTSAIWTSPVYDTTFSTPVGGVYYFDEDAPVGSTVTYQLREKAYSHFSTTDTWTTVSTTTSGAYIIPLTKQYWQEQIVLETSYSTQTPVVALTQVTALSSGTYYSKPQYIGTNITSWGLFSADQQLTVPGQSTYYIRAADTAFGMFDTSPSWTAQPNSAIPAISTGAYVQFKVDLAPTTSTNTLQVDGVNVSWREGESKPLASLYDDHRYILCANTSTSTVINDLCLVWQKNKKWIPFSGQSWGALARFNNYAIAGDGSTASKVWKILDPMYLNDDGVAINAYWETKDFDYALPNQIKVPMKLWLEADNIDTSFLTVGFETDKGSIFTEDTIDLAQSAYLNTNVSSIFDGFALGKYLKFRFSDNTLNSTFRLNAYTVYYDSKPLGQE